MVKFEPTTQQHIEHVAENMRKQDVIEIKASHNHDPLTGLTRSVSVSNYSVTILIDDEPVAIFGLTIQNIIAGIGIPWMLGTDQVTLRKKTLLPYSREVIDQMLKITPRMYNYVHSKNTLSIRWLTWLGFRVDKSSDHRMHNQNEIFYKFEMRV